MIQTPEGWHVLEGDQASRWIGESHRLDYDRSVEQVLPYLEPGDCAIDVGAMLGAYAGPMKKKVGPTGRVLAYEPCIESFQCLRANCPDVEAFNCGLSDVYEERRLKIVRDNMGTSHFAREGDAQWQDEIATLYPLDEIIPKDIPGLKLVKLDAEGYESKILAGAKETICKFCPVIFLEINHHYLHYYDLSVSDVIDPMVKLGYAVKFISDRHTFNRQQFPQVDIFLLPPNHAYQPL